MNWTKFLDETMGRIGTLQAQTPKMFEGFNTMGKAAKKSGALDEKTKEFIALGIGISTRCDSCIGFHVKALHKLGATRAELEEMLNVCVYMGGGPALMYAAEALKAWETLAPLPSQA